MRRWRFSKLGASTSLKECERAMRGGGPGGAMLLLLLFRAARCERTFQMTQKRRTQCRSMGQLACKGAPTGRGLWVILGIKAIQEPEL